MERDANFIRAHKQYLTPPEEPDYDECGECGGTGVLTDEQGQETECHVCKGDGSTVETKAERQERIEEEKGDMQREEQIFRANEYRSWREESEGYDL